MSKIVQLVHAGSGEVSSFLALHEDGAISLLVLSKDGASLCPIKITSPHEVEPRQQINPFDAER